MTVSTTTSRVEYAGNGSTTAFSVPFYFLANGDLKVYQGGTLKTITTDYTVTGAGNQAGGTVTFLSAPATGENVVIYRDPAITQQTDYPPNDPFPAESHEQALDRLTMISQRLSNQIGRAIRLPEFDTEGLDMVLPSAADRASKFLSFDSDGDVTAVTATDQYIYFTPTTERFSGTGAQTAFTLATEPAVASNLIVNISGVVQTPGADFTVSGNTLTFTTAPVAGTNNITVQHFGQAVAVGEASSLNRYESYAVGTGITATNVFRVFQDTTDKPGIGVVMHVARTVDNDEGLANPKTLRVATQINVDTAQAEWAISAEVDNYSDTDGGSTGISSTVNNYADGQLFAGHFNAIDRKSYNNALDVTAIVGIEAHAYGMGPDDPTANSGAGLRITHDVVGRTPTQATPTWSSWAALTAYSQYDIRKATAASLTAGYDGFYYVATTAGTSGAVEPTWPTTVGDTVVDGTVTWTAYRGGENGVGVRIRNETGTPYGWFRYGMVITDDLTGSNPNSMDTAIRIRTGGTCGIHMPSSAGKVHSSADVLLEQNSAVGVNANGTYTTAAFKMRTDQYVSWHSTNALKTRFNASTLAFEFDRAGTLRAELELDASPVLKFNGTKVLKERETGFTTAAGSASKNASGINVGTITATDANIRAVAAWVKALHDSLANHGIIGA